MSSVGVNPEQFPVISAQLNAIMAEAFSSVAAVAPISIAAPPGSDFVSPMLTTACQQHAAVFFPASLDGIGFGTQGACVLPTIGADYALTDLLGDIQVSLEDMPFL